MLPIGMSYGHDGPSRTGGMKCFCVTRRSSQPRQTMADYNAEYRQLPGDQPGELSAVLFPAARPEPATAARQAALGIAR